LFSEDLKKSGWEEIIPDEIYQKGSWKAWYDTSSVLIIENKNNQNIFPIHHPKNSHSNWTVNLIEYLCTLEDERFRLTQALNLILKSNPNTITAEIAQNTLSSCHHRWHPEGDGTIYYCAICGIKKYDEKFKH
jgi:hypothetical protein